MKHLNILIIDDNPLDLDLIRHALSDLQFGKIFTSTNVVSSIDFLVDFYDEYNSKLLVICDINLIKYYGPDHLRNIGEVFEDAVLVASSGTLPSDDFFSQYPEIDHFLNKNQSFKSFRNSLIALALKTVGDTNTELKEKILQD